MKFSIITPARNSEAYIRDAIESVISQSGTFDIEYIIMDGNSTDKTVEIAQQYKKDLEDQTFRIQCNNISMEVISEKDGGMYDAINKGFAKATGDVFAWINSDDMYQPGAFETMRKAFEAHPDIEWVKGITSVLNKKDNAPKPIAAYVYNQPWIKAGIYGVFAPFIHQDSVFWRKSLWQKVSPINAGLKLAGDYDLWVKMAQFAKLWSIDCNVSIFRKREGQLSTDIEKYRQEQRSITRPYGMTAQLVKIFFWLRLKLPIKIHKTLYNIMFPTIDNMCLTTTPNGTIIKQNARSYTIQ